MTDRLALEKFRGTGWHLVQYILGGEEAYLDTMHMMRIGSSAVEVATGQPENLAYVLVACFKFFGMVNRRIPSQNTTWKGMELSDTKE